MALNYIAVDGEQLTQSSWMMKTLPDLVTTTSAPPIS